ncbi:MAG: phenylalanine--tRNA ligase subunit beta [Terriglobales bacterium]
MKISPQWLREFVDLRVDNHRLADELTLAGIAVEGVSGEGDATVFEMEITTNRPDAMNHYGIARECSALYDVPLKPLDWELTATKAGEVARPTQAFPLEIQDAEGCARYTARVIRGVKIKASPDAIAKRLISVDQRPINNAADASNYTLWEMGHPTHAFDLNKLDGGKIIVRRAKAGETLKTLDGVERKLATDDLIIADATKPVALAGIMGGFDSMITENTKNVLIEAAWFDPATVRKTSKRLGMHTDASHRFERGADYGATSVACARVAQRILAWAGGEIDGDEIDVVARQLDLAPVALRVSEVHRILGEKIGANEIVGVLKRLGFDLTAEPSDEPEFTATIPSWRLDIEREIDLIEEIARMHGYDKFANTLPAYVGAVVDLPEAKRDEKLRSDLLALGYDETISLSFISHEDAKRYSKLPPLELENPLSAEASVMRTSLVPGMLNMLAYNLNRGSDNVRLFEAGNVFQQAGTTAEQLKRICLGATGQTASANVHQPVRALSFFDLKGDIEDLLGEFGYQSLSFEMGAADYYHPGRSGRAVMDGTVVAEFGQIHPDVASARKLKQDVYVAELYLDRLYQHDLKQVRYQALSQYPAVERDFSFIFDDAVSFGEISAAVHELRLKELRQIAPVEIFRGGSVPAGKHSLLLRAKFQANERTLRDEDVAQWTGRIVKVLETLGGVQRA